METLKQGREVEYGFLGVQPSNLMPRELQDGQRGMRIDKVVPGTPAHRFGLRRDDVITEVNGEPVYDADGLVLHVGKLPVEATANLAVVRDGRTRQVEVELAKYPVQGRRIVTSPEPSWRGLRIDYPTAMADAAFFDRNEFYLLEGCVVVVDVEEGSPAWKAGLRRDMVITSVESNRVQTPRDFRAAIAGKTGPVQVHLGVPREEKPLRTIEPDNG